MKKIKIGLILLHIIILGACVLWFPFFRKGQFLGSYRSAEDRVFAATGYWSEEKGTYYVDEQTGEAGVFTCGPYLDLKKGVYEVTVYYESTGSGHICYAHDDDAHTFARALYADTVVLDADHTMKQFTVWVNKPLHYFEIRTEYAGNGSLAIKQVVVRETVQTYIRAVFKVLSVLLLLDAALLLWNFQRNGKLKRSSVLMAYLLGGIVLLTSAPYLKDGILTVADRQTVGDNNIHLMRIAGLAEGLRNGQFPVWIHPEWLNGYGYAIPLFYGDLFLYLPAILLLVGFPLFWVYNCYLVLFNLVTCLVAYFCYKGMFHSRKAALLCSALSTWSVYRMTIMVNYESLGVFTSFAFLPLVAYGLYLIYFEAKSVKAWLVMALGMTGLIQSHLLTSEITAMALALTILFSWKSFWKKERVLAMGKAVGASVLLNLGFLVPFLSYMGKDLYVTAVTWTEESWQNRGPSLAEHLTLFAGSGTERKLDFILLCVLFLFLLLLVAIGDRNLSKESERYKKIGLLSTLLCVIFTWMSTSYFPWDWIYVNLPWTHWLTASIQEPMRFVQLAEIFGIVTAGCTFILLKQNCKTEWRKYYLAGISAVLFLSFGALLSDYFTQGFTWGVYDVAGLDTTNIATREYLPAEADPFVYRREFPIVPENVLLIDYEKRGTDVSFVGQNLSGTEARVQLPLTYYWDYQAKTHGGEKLIVECSGEKTVQIVLPAGFEGIVEVCFKAPAVWYLAKAVSAITVIVILYILLQKYCILNRRKTDESI